jgi:hypothetical protein
MYSAYTIRCEIHGGVLKLKKYFSTSDILYDLLPSRFLSSGRKAYQPSCKNRSLILKRGPTSYFCCMKKSKQWLLMRRCLDFFIWQKFE